MTPLQLAQYQLNNAIAQKTILDNNYAIACGNNANEQAALNTQIANLQAAATATINAATCTALSATTVTVEVDCARIQ